MPQPTNENNAAAGANNGQPTAAGSVQQPAINGFAGGTPPEQKTEDQAQGSGTPENKAAGSSDTEIPEAYRTADGTLDAAKALARLKEIEEASTSIKEKFGEVPEGDYTFGEIELEGGDKFTIDMENPFLKEALGLFKEAKIGQKGAEQFAAIYAKALAGDVPKIVEAYVASQNEAINKEIESLGDNRTARIDSVMSRVDELLSTDGKPVKGAGRSLLNDIRTRANFEALENLLERIDGKGRRPNSQVVADSEDDVVSIYGSRGFKKQGAG